MGTNYYVKREKYKKCSECGRDAEQEEVHIGKNSFGWKFLFDTNGGRFMSFQEVRLFLERNRDFIYNEYGDKMSLESLLYLVESRKDSGHDLKSYYAKNPDPLIHPEEEEFYDDDGYRFSHRSFS